MPADENTALHLLRGANEEARRWRCRRHDHRHHGRVRTLRVPPRDRRAACPWPRREHEEGAPADARERPEPKAPPRFCHHHRQRSRRADLPQPRQGHRDQRAEPAVGSRHHLRHHRRRLRLSSCDPRRPFAACWRRSLRESDRWPPGHRWSRKVVGYALSRRIDARLALAASRAAIQGRDPPPGCIHHSDRGSQYATRPKPTELCWTSTVSSARWDGAAIRTTTPRPRAS
jgi:hypothetical protein